MSSQVAQESYPKIYVETVHDCARAISRYIKEHPDDPNGARSQLNSRELAHEDGQCYSPSNGKQPIFALLGHKDVQTLEGRLLTIIDAAFGNPQQCRAVKDLVSQTLWDGWVPMLDKDN